jgi:hypothetical protein
MNSASKNGSVLKPRCSPILARSASEEVPRFSPRWRFGFVSRCTWQHSFRILPSELRARNGTRKLLESSWIHHRRGSLCS